MSIDLIITTYKPEKSFMNLIEEMEKQTAPIRQIHIVNTEQKHFERMIFATNFMTKYKNMNVRHISRNEFDDGATRNEAVKRTDAEYILFMSQDAMPSDSFLVERLYEALRKNPKACVAYARQVAGMDANEGTRYVYASKYPRDSHVFTLDDLDEYHLRTYRISNTCALYRRSMFDELGGFSQHTIGMEGMEFGYRALQNGYQIAYVAEASVYHSREISAPDKIKTSFDDGAFYAMHPEIIGSFNIVREMARDAKCTVNHLRKNGRTIEAFSLNLALKKQRKALRKGLRFEKIGLDAAGKYSANPVFWKNESLRRDRALVNARLGYGRSEEELRMLSERPNHYVKKEETEE